MDDNPFPGGADLAYPIKHKSKKQLKREAKIAKEKENILKGKTGMIGDVLCTCGAWQRYQCTLYFIHDDDCSINLNRKKK